MLIFLNEAIRLFLIKEKKKQLIYWNHSFLYCDREHMTSTQRGGGGFCPNVDANDIRIGKTRKICGQGGGRGSGNWPFFVDVIYVCSHMLKLGF